MLPKNNSIKNSKERNVLQHISIISKDEALLRYNKVSEGALQELKTTMSPHQLALLEIYIGSTNGAQNRLRQIVEAKKDSLDPIVGII